MLIKHSVTPRALWLRIDQSPSFHALSSAGKQSSGLKMRFFFFLFCFLSYGPLKRRGNIWLAVSTQLKSQHLWWYKGSLVHIAWVTCLEAPLTICWKIYRAFGATYAAIQMIWLSGKSLACDAEQHSACLQENILEKAKVSENWTYPKSRLFTCRSDLVHYEFDKESIDEILF